MPTSLEDALAERLARVLVQWRWWKDDAEMNDADRHLFRRTIWICCDDLHQLGAAARAQKLMEVARG